MMTSLIMSILLEKLCEKWLKYTFFLKFTLRQLKKDFLDLLSAFESQDNMPIEYI